jgi:uncharacterized protein involved in exopolysaccharide biosynthesis
MPKLFSDKWDAQRNQWQAGERPPTPAQAYKHFDSRVRTVVQDKKTGLITLRIDWRDRNESAAWANKLIDKLNAEMRGRAITKTNASVGYLERELQKTSVVGTRESINRLIEAQIKQRMLANVTPEYAFRVVDPALPSDEDDPVKPRKAVLIVGGPMLGLLFGIALVLVVGWLRRPT